MELDALGEPLTNFGFPWPATTYKRLVEDVPESRFNGCIMRLVTLRYRSVSDPP